MKFAFALLSVAIACSPGERDGPPPATEARTPRIQAAYALSDGFGYVCSIVLRADGGFTFRWMGDTGLVAQANGEYVLGPATVRFEPQSQDFRQDAVAFASVMHRIRWAQREYLIPEERLLDFANAINAGREPRRKQIGTFYLREGDELTQVTGFPALPGLWSQYLLPARVEGVVTAVKQKETPTQRPVATIDRGSRSGLRKGMKFFAFNPDRPNFRADLTVTEVREDSATVVVPFQHNHIRNGDRVTSREFDAQPAN